MHVDHIDVVERPPQVERVARHEERLAQPEQWTRTDHLEAFDRLASRHLLGNPASDDLHLVAEAVDIARKFMRREGESGHVGQMVGEAEGKALAFRAGGGLWHTSYRVEC